MARIYITPYGVGLGHASRMSVVGERLEKLGARVKFSSFGEAANYIIMHGHECQKVPSVELSWSSGGSFSLKTSIAMLPLLFTNFARQVNAELRNILEYRPDIIVSDTRLSSLVSARILQIPSIVILNQIKLLLSPRLRDFRIARSYEDLNGEFLGLLWTLADKILIPDLPPPYTIAEENIWNIMTVRGKVQYIGFAAPKPSISEEKIRRVCNNLSLDRSRPIIFVHISGPLKTRTPIIKVITTACKGLRPEIQYIISSGTPNGDPDARRLACNGWYYEWCPVRDELFALSDLLVIRGGHSVISQAIIFGKPIVCIPIENHGEQIGNCKKVSKIGIGRMISPNHLNGKSLTSTVHQLIDDRSFQAKVHELMEISQKLDGIDNIVKIVRSFVK